MEWLIYYYKAEIITLSSRVVNWRPPLFSIIDMAVEKSA